MAVLAWQRGELVSTLTKEELEEEETARQEEEDATQEDRIKVDVGLERGRSEEVEEDAIGKVGDEEEEGLQNTQLIRPPENQDQDPDPTGRLDYAEFHSHFLFFRFR